MHRFRGMRVAVALWLLLCMGAAFASPLLRPARYEVICGASGKAHLVRHDANDFGEHRPSSFHAMDCTLCVGTHAAPPAALAWPAIAAPAHDRLRPHAATHAHATNATPPPARAPPCHVSLFFQQSSERSI